MIKKFSIAVIFIFVFSACISFGEIKGDLPEIVFNAFANNDPGLFSKDLMTEAKYRILTKGSDSELTKSEYEQKLKEASLRARKNAETSFKEIRGALVKKGFDFSKAELIRVETTVRKGFKTERIQYSHEMKDQRLDIHLIIKSGDRIIDLKIDDCFLIEQKRYIGDGFKWVKGTGQ